MNKKRITLLTLLSLSLVVTGCANKDNNNSNNQTNNTQTSVQNGETTQSNNQPAEVSYKYIKNGSFVVGKDGAAIENDKSVAQDKNIEWFIDPYCPACGKFEEIMAPKVQEILDKDLTIRYNMLSFLSVNSVDDYSNRAASFMLATAEKSPELARKYLEKIMSASFQPKSSAPAAVSDDKFKEAYIEVGGKAENWQGIQELQKKLMEDKVVASKTAVSLNNKDLLAKSPSGRLSTPFFVIGDSQKALDFSAEEDIQSYTMKSIDKYLEDKNMAPKTETTTKSN